MENRVNGVSVLDMEFKGEDKVLERGYKYTAACVEVIRDGVSEIHLHFMNENVDRTRIIYDSFVSFAKDWRVIGDHKFGKAILEPKNTPAN